MGKNSGLREIVTILLVSLILAISYIYPEIRNSERLLIALGGFLVAIGINILAKKIVAYNLEADVQTKLWDLYYFGFREKRHFKKPVPMIWLTPLLSMISRGAMIWMPLLEFEVSPRVERVAKRHELYRFANMTEWHLALIVFWSLIANVFAYVVLSFCGLREMAIISLYYAMWSMIPVSGLDGSRLLFGSRKLWVMAGIILLIAFVWQSMIF